MMPDDESLAAEFALGTLDAAERGRLRDAMSRDPGLDRLVQSWEARLAPLSDALPAVEPPADLLPRIESRIFGAAMPGTVPLRAAEGTWQPMAAGVEAKILWQNAALGRQSLLIRVGPGATYESHHHADDEECLVLEGDLSFADHHLQAGDYHLARKGGTHPPASSKAGCLLYISTGWRS